jgi:hypothetical protein
MFYTYERFGIYVPKKYPQIGLTTYRFENFRLVNL